MQNAANWLNEQTGGQPLLPTTTGGANIPYFPAGGETPTGEMAGEYGSSPYNWPITQPEEPTAPAGVEENTIAEEKLGLRKRTELHAIQRAYRKALERMVNSLDYGEGGEEGYWSGPSGGYWDGYGGGGGYDYGGGGYSPEDVSSFWLNLARWNI
jgi:hypothetical protein